MNKDPCRDCIILEKSLRYLIDIYCVADEYEGEQREELREDAYKRVVKMFTGKE